MILRKEDLTEEALSLEIWHSLCDIAGVEPGEIEPDELEITEARKV